MQRIPLHLFASRSKIWNPGMHTGLQIKVYGAMLCFKVNMCKTPHLQMKTDAPSLYLQRVGRGIFLFT